MPKKITLKTMGDERGYLTVIDKVLPFEIKRVYYIYGVPADSIRGGHRHKKSRQALICARGTCVVSNHNGKEKEDIPLDDPNVALILEPEDWHTMHTFSSDCMILVLSSEHYDPNDYITEGYE